ncbi:MAG: glycosyltransferase [Gordonia sp. (in: high G+C Gram-positive bacteria)]|uniref:glycosyltransferase n=1 Tax=Gordonia sp. (in: high G+C Gram-positive bacteria) TaxID=84139 RepID=UPI0039E3A266
MTLLTSASTGSARPDTHDSRILSDRVQAWADQNTWDRSWRSGDLLGAKSGRAVSVVIPAHDDEETVGTVVAGVVSLLGGLVDEVVVIDCGSVDATAQRAAAAGARVETRESVLPRVPVRPGRGEVLWRAPAAASGDLIVVLDADLVDPDPDYVPRLVAPLIVHPELRLVKGFSRSDPQSGDPAERVVQRLIASLLPELAGVEQVLSGGFAATRSLLNSLPMAPGSGVEVGLLTDTLERYGLDAIGQANLGLVRRRRWARPDLAVVACQAASTLLQRVGTTTGAPSLEEAISSVGFAMPAQSPARFDRPPLRAWRTVAV